jgi:signal peptidase I
VEPAEGVASPTASVRAGLLRLLWEWTRSLALAFVLFLFLRAFVVEAFSIPTASMENTVLVGDFLLVNKAVYGAEIPGTALRLPAFADPAEGDVIVFTPPHDPAKNYVKRLMGVPGDTLEMRDKVLYRNGRAVAEPYVHFIDSVGDAVHPGMVWQESFIVAGAAEGYRPTRDNWGPIVVPGDRYFVLGDNRDNSEDSRYWGFVPRDAIHGRPWFVYFSSDTTTRPGLRWRDKVRWKRIGAAVR